MTGLISKAIAGRQPPLPAGAAAHNIETSIAPDRHDTLEYADVLGVRISAVDMSLAVHLAEQQIAAGKPGYVCVTGVHGVMEAQTDPELLHILNHAAINLPDGMPMTWIGRLQGFQYMDRVFGPDFMMAMCRISVERGYRHFFYGGKPGIAELLSETLQRKFPGLQVAGVYTPPFRDLNQEEETELAAKMLHSRPHILWIGLSTPRQERFMAQYAEQWKVPLSVGVGAAFDFHTGQIRDCSNWIKRAGLQWLHRLLQDPKRLWKRYLRNNPAFLWHIAWQIAGLREYPRDRNPAA